MKGLTLEFSFDDGSIEDLRVAELLEKYGFTGTFFIPSKNDLSREEILKLAEKHKVGGHTISHPQDLKLLDDVDLDYEIGGNRKWLQDLTGQPVDDFCYPRGRYDDRVIEAVKRAGFARARTTAVGWHFGKLEYPFRIPTTVHMYNRKEYNGMTWPEYAQVMFSKALHSARKFGHGYYHLWGHSWELTKFDCWQEFEDHLKYIYENLPR